MLAEGLGSVTEKVHGAIGAIAETKVRRGARAKPSQTDGRSSRWAAHRATRRDELIDAAIVAISRHGGVVGMDQIASVAKTSKPVIYRYFIDKNDLYRAVSQRVVGNVLTVLLRATSTNPEPRELMHAGVDAYLGLLEDNPELYRFVARHPLISDAGSGDAAPTDFSTVVAELISRQLAVKLEAIGPSLESRLSEPAERALLDEIERRRPIIESVLQRGDGNRVDQRLGGGRLHQRGESVVARQS